MRQIGLRSCDCCGSLIDDGSIVVELGDLTIDREFQRAQYKGQVVKLTAQQFECLELLVQRAGKLVMRHAFFITILDEDCEEKQLDVIICRLRERFRKVDPQFDRLQTLWGRGFTWLLPNQERLAA